MDEQKPEKKAPSNNRPEPKTAVGHWLRRFENPTAVDLIVVVGVIPVVALLALVIFAWLLG